MRASSCATSRLYTSLQLIVTVLLWCATMATASPAQTLTTLHFFAGQPNDGREPYAGLVLGSDGNFYGTTQFGGANNKGTVFQMTPSGTVTILHSFSGTDGQDPTAALIQASDGNFYGTTSIGGSGGSGGTVFKISSDGTLTTLVTFNGQGGPEFPYSGLIQASDGNFYGTTPQGGTNHGNGTVYKITSDGTVTTLYSFACTDGCNPFGGLVQGSDGNFYGTTRSGGTNGFNFGTVFKITPGGNLTTLHVFEGTDGGEPYASLIQGTDGNFYGTTSGAGANSGGTVFKITPGGALTTLYNFCSQSGCADGEEPYAGLIQATDGNFYGTTYVGGANHDGTIFGITPQGTLTTLHSFTGGDGASPEAGLIQANGANFYGTTSTGGPNGDGTIFQLQVQLNYTLTVSTSGDGTVTSTDGFIHCPGTCSHSYPGNTPVTLDATPSGGWVFGGWNGACLGTGSCNVTMTGNLSVGAVFSQALQFVSVTPCRLVDTRGTQTPIIGGTAQSFTVPQLGGCDIPDTASAYSLNVTVVPHGPLGYLTIWPTGENQPVVSTMNSLDGRTKANAAIVPAGTSGAVSVYASNTTDLVLDIDGYFTTLAGQTADFYPLTPCRVIDTRGSNSNLGGPFLTGGMERDFNVLTSSCIPANVNPQAYSFNVTVVPHTAGTALGYLTIWPQGETQPTVSTLNNPTATDVANAAIVPAGNNGAIAVFPSNDTDLVIDINGYFAAPGTGGLSLYPVSPCRVLDTRGVGSGNPIVGEYTVNVVGSVCSPPSNAKAYVFNATVVPSGALGYLSLWPDGLGQPVVSTLNALDGAVTSNMAIVPTQNGSIDAYASNLTQLVLDISSYFAP